MVIQNESMMASQAWNVTLRHVSKAPPTRKSLSQRLSSVARVAKDGLSVRELVKLVRCSGRLIKFKSMTPALTRREV